MTLDPQQTVAPARPVPVVAVAPRAKSGGILNLLLIGAAILAVGGVAFAIGRSSAPASAFQQVGAVPGGGTVIGPGGSFAPGAGGPPGFALGGSLSMDGTVSAIDADSLTLKLDNGDELTFKLDAATTFRESTEADPTDVAVGDEVTVNVAGDGRIQAGGDGQGRDLTAGDVTVAR
jgi:hypothetical protein